MLKEKCMKSWKSSSNRKALVVQGARQVGKTYAIRTFADSEYDELIEINFKEKPGMTDVFSGNLDVDTMLLSLRFRFPDRKFVPGRTIIFLDEIQECPEAITSLKFWTIDGRFDVVASGSMLGIDYKRASSYPVGYVEYIQMTGLDFEEFLWSQNITDDMIQMLRSYFDNRSKVPDFINADMMNYFRSYIALGGMPEVVQNYCDNNNYLLADKTQKEILTGYRYDIAHYAVAEEKVKAEKCFLTLGKQLLDKENHKFQYKEIEHGARAQKYFTSLDWLLSADIIKMCRLVSDVKYDLEDYARDDFFRAYSSDLSLLIAMRDLSLKQMIIENTLINNTKGGIYECAIADILMKKSYQLYFYKHEKKKLELDFLIQKNGSVIPIEVKGGHTKSVSLNIFLNEHPEITLAYKFIDGNVGSTDSRIITMPLYMAMFI